VDWVSKREAVSRLHLATPQCVTDCACILVLEVPRVRLDIQDVAKGGIGVGGARGVRAGDRLQAGKGWIAFRVLVEDRRGLFGAGGGEVRLKNEGFRGVLRGHRLVVTAVLTFEEKGALRLGLVIEVVGADRTEAHRVWVIL
jgi:hypothetical protein